MHIPSGINISLSGSYEDQQDSFSDLLMLGVLIILLVYIVMAASLRASPIPASS